MASSSPPILVHPGGEFVREEVQQPAPEALVGSSLAIAFTARWNRVDTWGHVICFGRLWDEDDEPADLIRIFNRGNSTLTFEIAHGPRENYRRVDAVDAIRKGAAQRFHCSVNTEGTMSIHIDGALRAQRMDGWVPQRVLRDYLSFGGYRGRRDAYFFGRIAMLNMWAGAVPVPHGVPPEETSSDEAFSPKSPAVTYPGRRFTGRETDFDDLSSDTNRRVVSGEMSVSFAAQWDHLEDWSHVLCLCAAQGEEYTDAVRIFGRAGERTLTFEISHGSRKSFKKVDASSCITPGEMHTYLCTVTYNGEMRIYRDGVLLAVERAGWPPLPADRSHLLVGQCFGGRAKSAFAGSIRDLSIWRQALDWGDLPPFAGLGRRGRKGPRQAPSPVPLARAPTSKGQGQVVVNCASVGHEFARMALKKPGNFDWKGVRSVLRYYKSKGFFVHAVCKARTLQLFPIPDGELKRVVVPAPAQAKGPQPGKGDLFTLRIAEEHGCAFVDNCCYRDWQVQPWLLALRVSFLFLADGSFVPNRAL